MNIHVITCLTHARTYVFISLCADWIDRSSQFRTMVKLCSCKGRCLRYLVQDFKLRNYEEQFEDFDDFDDFEKRRCPSIKHECFRTELDESGSLVLVELCRRFCEPQNISVQFRFDAQCTNWILSLTWMVYLTFLFLTSLHRLSIS